MRVIDLSHTIDETTPVYPGTQPPTITPASTYEADGFAETLVSLYTHTGTHIDPPAHIFEGRTTLDAFPPEQFIGKALVIDVRSKHEGEAITMDDLAPYGDLVHQADFLLFNLGWDRFWKTDAYFGDYACPDFDVIDFVTAKPYKGIGLDVIGLDPIPDEDLPRHKRLFRDTDIINIENLCNLDACAAEAGGGLFNFSCFPLPLAHADGCPARAIAWFD